MAAFRISFATVIAILLFSLPSNAFSLSLMEFPVADSDTVITILPFPSPTDPPIPRSPSVVPINASYESMISSVILTFSYNLGEIEVEVLNTTSGGYDSGTVGTQFLYATVPITMGPGHYLILFTLPSGQRYKGELDI